MKRRLPHLAILFAIYLPGALGAEDKPLSVCEALDSARDHQVIVIRAKVDTYRHGTNLSEGTDGEPCKDWPRRFFTAPSLIPLVLASAPGVHLTEAERAQNKELLLRLAKVRTERRPEDYVLTIKGTLLRKALPLIFRLTDGEYIGLGLGTNGEYAAVFVAQSVLKEGYR